MIKRVTLKKALSVFLVMALVFTAIPFNSDIAKAAGNGSTFASAEDIQLDQNKTITFTDGDQQYFCKFTVPKQGVLTIKTVDKNMTSQAFGFEYVLHQEDGKVIWGGQKKSYNSLNPNYSGSVGVKAGTYILNIDPGYFYKETRTIDLAVNFAENNYCEIESNEYVTDATPMELGHFYDIYFSGGTHKANTGDNDYFKFTAEKNKFYRATITNFDVVDPTTTLMALYNPLGEQVDNFHFQTKVDKDGNYYYDFKTEMAGEYKVRIYNYHGDQIAFKLKLAKCPYYPEFSEYDDVGIRLSKAKGGYDDVHLSWYEVRHATGYEVYIKKGSKGSYVLKGRTTKLYFDAKNLVDGAKYYFKVRPYYSDGSKIYAKNVFKYANIWTMKKVSTPYVKRSSLSKYVDLSWKKVNGDVKYQISQSTSKTGTNIVVASVYTNKYTYLQASSRRGYYYKVRAVYEYYDNGKNVCVYAPWSSAKYYR